jgi:transcriptional antiterminator RfaH
VPLLPLETFVFPELLLSDRQDEPPSLGPDVAGTGVGVLWWVLHTRPRAEKALARKLLQREVPYFLPLNKRQWRHNGRLHSSYNPLFPGYVFVRGEHGAISTTWETNLIARILRVDDQEQLQVDLRRIYYLITSGLPLSSEDRLTPGTWVEITCGALAGLEGRVLRRGRQLKLIIEVQFLQQGVSVEVESWMIQAKSEHLRLEVSNR